MIALLGGMQQISSDILGLFYLISVPEVNRVNRPGGTGDGGASP
jgi:hypothetical protein